MPDKSSGSKPATERIIQPSRAMLRIWIVGLLGSLCGGINAFTGQEWEENIAEVKNRIKEIVELPDYNEEVLNIYTETTKFLPPGHPAAIGKNEIREYSKRIKNSERGLHTYDITAQNVIASSREFVIVWFNFILAVEGRNTRQGKSIVMLRDVDGEVKIEVDIWNFNA